MTDDRLIIYDNIMHIVMADWSSDEENGYEYYSGDEYEYYSANELDNIVEPTYNDVTKKPDVSNPLTTLLIIIYFQ